MYDSYAKGLADRPTVYESKVSRMKWCPQPIGEGEDLAKDDAIWEIHGHQKFEKNTFFLDYLHLILIARKGFPGMNQKTEICFSLVFSRLHLVAFRQLLDCLRIVALIALRDALAASAALLEEMGRFCWLKADLCTETPWMRKCVRFISFCHICCKTMFFFEVSVSNILFQLVSPTSDVTAIARTPRPLQMRMWRKVLMRFWRQDTWRFATPLDKKASLLFLDMLLGSVFWQK